MDTDTLNKLTPELNVHLISFVTLVAENLAFVFEKGFHVSALFYSGYSYFPTDALMQDFASKRLGQMVWEADA